MIKKVLHILIYRNKFFIPLVSGICLLIVFFVISLVLKLNAKNRILNYEIFHVPFKEDVPLEAMEQVLKVVEENRNENLNNDLNFVNLLSLLAAKYRGYWSDFEDKDVNKLVCDFKKGLKESDLSKEIENYAAFKKIYSAVFSEMVGNYSISKIVDRNSKPVYESKFGIKSYFPIAYDFDVNFVDNFEKENAHVNSISHLGVDISAKVQTPIVAVESGVVKSCSKTHDFGWQVVVESLDGLRTYYYSNCYGERPFVDGLMPKTVVKAGQVLAYVGATSRCSQKFIQAQNCPHLHFGMSVKLSKDSKQSIWINPYRILQFLQHHKSVVQKQGDDYVAKYIFVDPNLEKHLN